MSHDPPAGRAARRGVLLPLMCAVARARLRDCDREAIDEALGAADFDFAALLPALQRHGLVPLAHRHLRETRVRAMPPVLALWLGAAFRGSEAKQSRAVFRLHELLEAFEAASLDVLPYKGPILGLQLYGDPVMRQYGDLDILVRPGHAPAAIALLIGRGFVPEDGVESDGGLPLVRHRHACGLRDPVTGVMVEVHWRLLDRMYGAGLPLEWLMEEPQSVELYGRHVPAMGGDRLLLSLCMHGASHQWERLVWLADVAELMRSEQELDWSRIRDHAARLRFTRNLAATLILVRELFGETPGSSHAAGLTEEPGARTFAERVLARLAAPGVPLSMAERFRLGWLGREGLLERATFAWRVATHLSSRDLGTSRWARVPGLAGTRRAVRLLREAAGGGRRG